MKPYMHKFDILLQDRSSCRIIHFILYIICVTFINYFNEISLLVKIADGIPLDRCLDDVKLSVTDSIEKVHFITKKDLRNIGTSYNLFNKERLHTDDATSVDLWVKEMKELENSPVLIYKPQGEDFVNLKINDFCLILVSIAQKEMFMKFGNDKICLDSTHRTNPYDFQLTTIIVIDDFGSGSLWDSAYQTKQTQIRWKYFSEPSVKRPAYLLQKYLCLMMLLHFLMHGKMLWGNPRSNYYAHGM